jgi:stage V sporulation protein SpoVS
MNTKMKVLSSAILMGISSIAVSADPPTVPAPYLNGPNSPLVASTDLSDAEKQAYAIYEGIMQIAEAKIHATSCSAAAGTSDINIFTDGLGGQTDSATVISNGGSFMLVANSLPGIQGRGQTVNVSLAGGLSYLAGTKIATYSASNIFNNVNNMMVNQGNVAVFGINSIVVPDFYQVSVIKDFNRGNLTNPLDVDYYTIFDWGLQQISKAGYPVNKYWQRSKSRRDNNNVGRTVFIKDRLVGSSSCRIAIDTRNWNSQNYFFQTGSLTISTDAPSVEVTAFNDAPFNGQPGNWNY